MPAPATSPTAKISDASVRDMIDRYCAAGLHQRLPTLDARILPTRQSLDWGRLTPNAAAADVKLAVSRRPAAPRTITDTGWPADTAEIATVGPCPSAPGSSRAARFSVLRVGATIAELRRDGLRLSDLTRYLGSGAVSLSVPTSSAGGAE